MTPRSAKAKGKVLEKLIRDTILREYPELTDEDVRVTIGQEGGSDLKLSRKALTYFNYKIEAKNRETFGSMYKFMDQCVAHKGGGEPIVIIKMNRRQPLVVISLDAFMKIVKGN